MVARAWSFNRKVLIIARMKEGDIPWGVCLNTMDLWVQIHDLRVGFMSERIVSGNWKLCWKIYWGMPKKFHKNLERIHESQSCNWSIKTTKMKDEDQKVWGRLVLDYLLHMKMCQPFASYAVILDIQISSVVAFSITRRTKLSNPTGHGWEHHLEGKLKWSEHGGWWWWRSMEPNEGRKEMMESRREFGSAKLKNRG